MALFLGEKPAKPEENISYVGTLEEAAKEITPYMMQTLTLVTVRLQKHLALGEWQ